MRLRISMNYSQFKVMPRIFFTTLLPHRAFSHPFIISHTFESWQEIHSPQILSWVSIMTNLGSLPTSLNHPLSPSWVKHQPSYIKFNHNSPHAPANTHLEQYHETIFRVCIWSGIFVDGASIQDLKLCPRSCNSIRSRARLTKIPSCLYRSSLRSST